MNRSATSLACLLLVLIVQAVTVEPTNAQKSDTHEPQHGLETKLRPANRLAKETSPYLLQHARNPVDWHPWGQEALQLAKQQNKLIFLSIGYSSCHWCHVMEHESFEDAEVARFMNDHFICVKVDREERPDVDAIYMLAVQIMTRRGGWPLSVFLTPDAKPFFGGTYFPARDGDRPGSPGFLTVGQRVVSTWQSNADGIERTAEQVAKLIAEEMNSLEVPTTVPANLAKELLDDLTNTFDETYGGFGYAAGNPRIPKFPQSSTLAFLLDQADRGGNAAALKMLTKTADRMAMGGLLDHLGGGFHRYSVDRYWAIPHFEKMLYDNGQLASIYARLATLTGNVEYRRVVEEMMTFIERDMTDESGAFYAAMDADSEGEEGKFFRWKKEEWSQILGEKEAAWLAAIYAPGTPNFEDEFYVPQIDVPWPEVAQRAGLSLTELRARLDPLRIQLLHARSQRVPPMTDTKILTSWNGLMIRGMADAGRELKRPAYIERAATAAHFVMDNLWIEGRLMRTFTAGKASLNAYLDDYAFLANGLIALHEATGEKEWLQMAQQITEKQLELFWDEQQGGFFFTSADHEQLIVRGKLFHEGARPSGSAVAAENLIYLAKATGDDSYRDKAQRTVRSAARILSRSPAAAPRMVMAADRL